MYPVPGSLRLLAAPLYIPPGRRLLCAVPETFAGIAATIITMWRLPMKRFVLPILLVSALPAADTRISPAMNAFTTACYRQLMGIDGNLILSPFNIATALSMTLAGARGRTADEMESVLHLHYDATYDASLGALLTGIVKAGSTAGNQLNIANGLWVQKDSPSSPPSRIHSPTTTTPH